MLQIWGKCWVSDSLKFSWEAWRVLFLKVHYWLFQLFFLQGTKNELYVDGSLFFFFFRDVVISWQQKSFDITKSKKCLLHK